MGPGDEECADPGDVDPEVGALGLGDEECPDVEGEGDPGGEEVGSFWPFFLVGVFGIIVHSPPRQGPMKWVRPASNR